MALDVHLYENGKIGRLLYQINDKTYGEVFDAFTQFKAKTGIFIDPYRDTIIVGQMGTLIACLEKAASGTALLSVLKNYGDDANAVIFVGD